MCIIKCNVLFPSLFITQFSYLHNSTLQFHYKEIFFWTKNAVEVLIISISSQFIALIFPQFFEDFIFWQDYNCYQANNGGFFVPPPVLNYHRW